MRSTIVCFYVCFAIACGSAAKPVAYNTNDAMPTNSREKPQTAIAHGPDTEMPRAPSGEKSKWTQSGDAIDTTKLDAAVMAAEKALAAKPADATAKKTLATAFLDRAMALTEARQYASALGDYRRTLKYDPANSEAQEWIDRIISIYSSINRAYPKEGEEPPPLPFTKTK